MDFIDTYPGIMQGDTVVVYPASTDRLKAKGVDKVIKIMAAIKSHGFKVCLCIRRALSARNSKGTAITTPIKQGSQITSLLRRDCREGSGAKIITASCIKKITKVLVKFNSLFRRIARDC